MTNLIKIRKIYLKIQKNLALLHLKVLAAPSFFVFLNIFFLF